MVHKIVDGKEVQLTADELAEYNAKQTAWNNAIADRKLAEIKSLRLERLIDTDWMACSDVTMPDNIKTWRQSLRDIPQDYTTESQYDLLLARDSDGKLTHTVWEKP